MIHAMSSYGTRVHEASGRIVLTQIHLGREADGLESITAMRWRDESGQTGQDSPVRLALHIERGGKLFVETEGSLASIGIESENRFLSTNGCEDSSVDPIMQLPTY